jgi:MFS transporter, DHA2 family, multidrug resistance protein
MVEAAHHPLPPGPRALVTAGSMLATLMVVLDTTIANVALPHMQASLGANSESIAWVLTSYILATAVAMPVTGWLAARFGRRTLFTVAVAGFTLTSALCGVANSLTLMVIARLLQGVFGAFIMPLGQAVLYDINPPERIVKAMTLWGITIMVGPIMGPFLGGYLTDVLDWRWVFFINVPIGIVTALGLASLPNSARERRPFDFIGFALLALALGSFQLMLDRGTHLDWFSSVEIIVEAGIALSAAWIFAIHTATAPHPLIPLALLKDRNLVSALIPAMVVGGVMMAGAVLLSTMVQILLEYPVYEAGLMVMPRGLGTMAGMLLSGRLLRIVDGRWIVAGGLLLLAWSLHLMTGFNLEMGSHPIIVTGLVQGFGMGMTMMPMNLLAFSTMPPSMRTDGASLYSLARNIGGSVSIAVGTALIASNLQRNHAELGSHITAITMPALDSGLIEQLGLEGRSILALLDIEINRQALMIAYLNDFWVLMWASILVLPLVLLMRPAKASTEPIAIGE